MGARPTYTKELAINHRRFGTVLSTLREQLHRQRAHLFLRTLTDACSGVPHQLHMPEAIYGSIQLEDRA